MGDHVRAKNYVTAIPLFVYCTCKLVDFSTAITLLSMSPITNLTKRLSETLEIKAYPCPS
jgi:hypothetical protein